MKDWKKEAEQLSQDLTEARQQAERAEFLFRTLAEYTADWEFWFDSTRQFIYVSPSCESISGYSKDEFLARSGLFKEIIHEDDEQLIDGLFERAFQDSTVSGVDFRITTKRGGLRWLSISLRPIKDDSEDEILGLRGSIRDITERRKNECDRVKWVSNLQSLFTLAKDLLNAQRGERLLDKVVETARSLMEGSEALGFWFDWEGKPLSSFSGEQTIHGESMDDSLLEQAPWALEGLARQSKARVLRFERDQEGALPANAGDLGQFFERFSSFVVHALLKDDGSSGGLILVSKDGDFSKEGEQLLTQLALLGSLGLRNLDARLRSEEQTRELEAMLATIRKQKAELEKGMEEQHTMLLEIHHRVKNNLQVVASLLNLQTSKQSDCRVKAILNEARARVQALSFVHELLYQKPGLSEVDLSQYLEKLLKMNMAIHRFDEDMLELKLDMDEISLSMDQAIPLGLITNELTSNALEHGLDSPTGGELRLSLKEGHGFYRLTVSDNGKGLPREFNIEDCASLGLDLVSSLSVQLEGELSHFTSDCGGSSFVLEFPKV